MVNLTCNRWNCNSYTLTLHFIIIRHFYDKKGIIYLITLLNSIDRWSVLKEKVIKVKSGEERNKTLISGYCYKSIRNMFTYICYVCRILGTCDHNSLISWENVPKTQKRHVQNVNWTKCAKMFTFSLFSVLLLILLQFFLVMSILPTQTIFLPNMNLYLCF